MKNLSIITVTRNDISGLVDTFSSIKDFDLNNIEWIVIDGSDEKLEDQILNDFGAIKFKYYFGRDTGIYNAMNKGLYKAKGDYCWFLNCGDKALISKSILDQSLREIGDEDLISFKFVINNKKRREIISNKYLIFNSPNHQSLFFKTSIHNKFDESLLLAADYKEILRIYNNKECMIKYIDLCLFKYDMAGITSKQISKNVIRKERIQVTFSLFKETLNFIFLGMFVVQFFSYLIFFLFPSMPLKRFKD